MRLKILVLFIALAPLQAQSLDVFTNDFSYGVSKGLELAEYPFENSTQFLTSAGYSLVATGVLFLADNEIRNFASRNQSNLNSNLFKIDSYFGNEYTLVYSAAFYGAGFFTNNKTIRKAGLNSFVSVVYASIFNQILKVIIGRDRPYMNSGNTTFSPISFNNDHKSLPSGHTTAAFAFATAMSESFENTYMSILMYSVAALTAGARIYHDQHWLSDTFLGAFIGYGIAKFVTSEKTVNSPLSFIVTPSNISLTYRLD